MGRGASPLPVDGRAKLVQTDGALSHVWTSLAALPVYGLIVLFLASRTLNTSTDEKWMAEVCGLPQPEGIERHAWSAWFHECDAILRYRWADAMLAERAKRRAT